MREQARGKGLEFLHGAQFKPSDEDQMPIHEHPPRAGATQLHVLGEGSLVACSPLPLEYAEASG